MKNIVINKFLVNTKDREEKEIKQVVNKFVRNVITKSKNQVTIAENNQRLAKDAIDNINDKLHELKTEKEDIMWSIPLDGEYETWFACQLNIDNAIKKAQSDIATQESIINQMGITIKKHQYYHDLFSETENELSDENNVKTSPAS